MDIRITKKYMFNQPQLYSYHLLPNIGMFWIYLKTSVGLFVCGHVRAISNIYSAISKIYKAISKISKAISQTHSKNCKINELVSPHTEI